MNIDTNTFFICFCIILLHFGPKLGQDRLKMGQDTRQLGQDRSQMGPRGVKIGPRLPKCGPGCLPLGWGGGWGSFGAMGQVRGNHFQVFFLSACAETQAGALPKGGDRGN